MNADDLRTIQAPLKERYKESPGAALVTLRAQGRAGEGVSCKIGTGKARIVAGLHPATGGTGHQACSGDPLLEALVACAGVTLNAVATSLGIRLREATLKAEGDLDFRGTLGVSKEVPVGFQNIRLHLALRYRRLRGTAGHPAGSYGTLLRGLSNAEESPLYPSAKRRHLDRGTPDKQFRPTSPALPARARLNCSVRHHMETTSGQYPFFLVAPGINGVRLH